MVKRNERHYAIVLFDNGVVRAYPCTLQDGIITLSTGTRFMADAFREVVIPFSGSLNLHVQMIAVHASEFTGHEAWDKQRRSLVWSSLTKQQGSGVAGLLQEALPILQWITVAGSLWFAMSASSNIQRVIAYLEMLIQTGKL